MRYLTSLLVGLGLTLTVAHAAPVKSGKASAELLLKHTSVPAGGSTTVALRLVPDAGWHSYWKNPGESGMPTSIVWQLPEGLELSALRFPAPHVFDAGGVKSLGYEGEVLLLADLSIGKNVEPGVVEIKGASSWLACTNEQCIPGNADLSTSVTILAADAKPVTGPSAKLIEQAAGKLPAEGKGWSATARRVGDKLELTIKPADGVKPDVKGLSVFVAQQSIVTDGAPAEWNVSEGKMIGTLEVSEYLEELPAQLDLVLVGAGHPHGVEVKCVTQK
ncbi:protein-disulfide reductase DsbD domain-containing protein [Oceaniferula spumae]